MQVFFIQGPKSPRSGGPNDSYDVSQHHRKEPHPTKNMCELSLCDVSGVVLLQEDIDRQFPRQLRSSHEDYCSRSLSAPVSDLDPPLVRNRAQVETTRMMLPV